MEYNLARITTLPRTSNLQKNMTGLDLSKNANGAFKQFREAPWRIGMSSASGSEGPLFKP